MKWYRMKRLFSYPNQILNVKFKFKLITREFSVHINVWRLTMDHSIQVKRKEIGDELNTHTYINMHIYIYVYWVYLYIVSSAVSNGGSQTKLRLSERKVLWNRSAGRSVASVRRGNRNRQTLDPLFGIFAIFGFEDVCLIAGENLEGFRDTTTWAPHFDAPDLINFNRSGILVQFL